MIAEITAIWTSPRTRLFSIYLGALLLAATIGFASYKNVIEYRRRAKYPIRLWSASRYDRIAEAVAQDQEVGFTTDMINSNGNLRIFSISYAVIPTRLVLKTEIRTILARLKLGGVNISDYNSPKRMEIDLAKFTTWAKENHVHIEIQRLEDNLAIIRTTAP